MVFKSFSLKLTALPSTYSAYLFVRITYYELTKIHVLYIILCKNILYNYHDYKLINTINLFYN